MNKLSYEDKIKLYNDDRGMTIKSLVTKYGVRSDIIKYLIRLINKNGIILQLIYFSIIKTFFNIMSYENLLYYLK